MGTIPRNWTPDAPLRSSEVAVLDCLQEHADPAGLVAMGLKRIERRSGGGNRSTTSMALKSLIARGALRIERQGDGRGNPATWRVLQGVDELADRVGSFHEV